MWLYHVINGHTSNTGREQNHQLPHGCKLASFYHFIVVQASRLMCRLLMRTPCSVQDRVKTLHEFCVDNHIPFRVGVGCVRSQTAHRLDGVCPLGRTTFPTRSTRTARNSGKILLINAYIYLLVFHFFVALAPWTLFSVVTVSVYRLPCVTLWYVYITLPLFANVVFNDA